MKQKSLGRLLLSLILAAALLYLFFRGADWPALRSAIASAQLAYIAAALLITMVTYLLRAWRWGGLLRPLAVVPFRTLFAATAIGFMAGLLIPRAGEVLRPLIVGRRQGIPASGAFASIILERLLDLFTVLGLFALYLFVLPQPHGFAEGPLMPVVRFGGAVAGGLAVAGLGLLFFAHGNAAAVASFFDGLTGFLPARIRPALSRMTRSFLDGLAVLKAPPRHLLALLGQSLLVWISIDLGVYWANRALGLDLPFHSTFLIIAFLTVGVAVPTPGGVGGYHETYLLALTQAFGVDHATAAAAALVSHACANVPVLAMGLWLLRGEGLTLSRVARVAEEGNA